jgi:hypothetical protein
MKGRRVTLGTWGEREIANVSRVISNGFVAGHFHGERLCGEGVPVKKFNGS